MGEPADLWIGVIEGLVKMSVTTPDGRASSFTAVTAGGWFGEGSLLKKGEKWRYEGIALRNTRLACVPRKTFERLLETSLPFNRFVLI
jgi:CRP/FNR family cyclic AMP-dependent transcriptional regulator